MKRGRFVKRVFYTFVIGFCVSLIFFSCKHKDDDRVFQDMQELRLTEYKGKEGDRERIKELKEGIKKYKKIVNKKIEAAGQLGVYYKMLAVEYLNMEMYGLALEALKNAITIYPENPVLFYLAGAASAHMSKAVMEPNKKIQYQDRAISYYQRSIDLDPRYVDALFGLAILYVFERDQCEKAVPLLEKVVDIEKYHFDAMFVLARCYYLNGERNKTLELYDFIIENSEVKSKVQKAKENKKNIMEETYGS